MTTYFYEKYYERFVKRGNDSFWHILCYMQYLQQHLKMGNFCSFQLYGDGNTDIHEDNEGEGEDGMLSMHHFDILQTIGKGR